MSVQSKVVQTNKYHTFACLSMMLLILVTSHANMLEYSAFASASRVSAASGKEGRQVNGCKQRRRARETESGKGKGGGDTKSSQSKQPHTHRHTNTRMQQGQRTECLGEIQRRHEAFATRDRTAGREVFFETLGRDAEKTSNHTNFVEVPNLPDTHREREREREREMR